MLGYSSRFILLGSTSENPDPEYSFCNWRKQHCYEKLIISMLPFYLQNIYLLDNFIGGHHLQLPKWKNVKFNELGSWKSCSGRPSHLRIFKNGKVHLKGTFKNVKVQVTSFTTKKNREAPQSIWSCIRNITNDKISMTLQLAVSLTSCRSVPLKKWNPQIWMTRSVLGIDLPVNFANSWWSSKGIIQWSLF